MRELTAYMDDLRSQGDGALAAFVMAGYPDLTTSFEAIRALEQGGCDLIELGIPFTDPLADGEIIESLHHYGVAGGITLGHTLEQLSTLIADLTIPVILFSYFNLLLCRGIEATLQELKDIGVSGLIIPDLPNHELYRVQGRGIEVVPLIAPSSTDQRIAMAAATEPAFIYCVSTRGVTGPRSLPQASTIAYLERVRTFTERPLALGFGISSPDDVRRFRGHADVFVVGSHLARMMKENPASPSALCRSLEVEMRRFKAAAQQERRQL